MKIINIFEFFLLGCTGLVPIKKAAMRVVEGIVNCTSSNYSRAYWNIMYIPYLSKILSRVYFEKHLSKKDQKNNVGFLY